MAGAGLAVMPGIGPDLPVGRIGPNAVIQLAEALRPHPGLAERVFRRAGLASMLNALPDEMIDETIPAGLFAALWREAPAAIAAQVAHEAGRLTGNYVLAHRIPRPARIVLRALPARAASALLLQAIRKHAWTFAGSGQCIVQNGDPASIIITGNPLRMPGGLWHVGVFEALFRALVAPGAKVTHWEIQQGPAPASFFDIFLRSRPKGQGDQTP